MKRKPVPSSNIVSVGYDKGTLEVEFSSGGIYQYKDVPKEVYKEFFNSESLGRYLHSEIKGKYEVEQVDSQ